MQHKSFSNLQCPIARSLERVGERWSILILRDAFQGLTRFDQFQKSLGIAPNILARRLKSLVEAGLLERRRYSAHPPRDEYLLTERGRDFRPVIWSLLAWGNKHLAPEGLERPAGGQRDRRPGRSGPGGSGERPAADRPGLPLRRGPRRR